MSIWNEEMLSEKADSSCASPLPFKIAVFTCITRGYDSLKVPLYVDERFDYFCFTDTPEIVKPPWKFLPIDLEGLSPKDQNRYVKMHPHELLIDYDISVYIDGSIQIVGDFYTLLNLILNDNEDIFLFSHPWRNCIYSEAAACAHFAFEWIWKIAYQMRRYNNAGFQREQGLFEAGVLIRKKTDNLRNLMNAWWDEYYTGVRRDQLSLTFVAWRLNIPLGSLGESDPRFGHRYFQFIERPRRRKMKLTLRKYINRSIAFMFSYEKLFGLATTRRLTI